MRMGKNARRVESSAAQYDGSKLAQRNAALARAKRIDAARDSQADAMQYRGHARVTNVLGYCTEGDPATGAQIHAGFEPYLLQRSPVEPGVFCPVSIYDRRIEAIEKRTGLCWIDLHAGEVLLPGDTLVYWK